MIGGIYKSPNCDCHLTRHYLEGLDWTVTQDMSTAESGNFILNHLNRYIENFIPLKEVFSYKPKPKRMDFCSVKAIMKKYHAWKRFTFSPSYRDSQVYCKLRNQTPNLFTVC